MFSTRSRATLLVVLLVVAFVAACGGSDNAAERDTATVERIADGDTLVLERGSRVRLVQIDAPELGEGECYAAASARELAGLVRPGSRIALEADPRLDGVDGACGAPRAMGRLSRLVEPGPAGPDPPPLTHSLVRGTFACRNRTFGSATQDLKRAPQVTDVAEL